MEITHTDQPPSAEDHAKLERLKSNYLEKLDTEVCKTVGTLKFIFVMFKCSTIKTLR
jgi:hypothetical protein